MKNNLLWLGLFCISLLSLSLFNLEVEADKGNSFSTIEVELIHKNESMDASHFLIYGISRENYEYAVSHKYERSVSKTKAWLSNLDTKFYKEVTIDGTSKATFYLPKHDLNHEVMNYVVIQNDLDISNSYSGEGYESFPIFFSLDTLVEENYLSIETKRVFISSVPYFFKYSSGRTQKPLSNAEFLLYRLNDNNVKEYLTDSKTLSFKVLTELEDAYKVVSDEDGLVILPTSGLSNGTYYFEEIRSPKGYEKTKASQQVKLVISHNDEGAQISVNDQLLESLQAGELPKEVIEKGEPRVLNDPLADDPKEDPKGKEKNPVRKGYLPQMGERVTVFTSVGLSIMFVAFYLMKRGKENE